MRRNLAALAALMLAFAVLMPGIASAQLGFGEALLGSLLFNQLDQFARAPTERGVVVAGLSINLLYRGGRVGTATDPTQLRVGLPSWRDWGIEVTPLVMGKPNLLTPKAWALYFLGHEEHRMFKVLKPRERAPNGMAMGRLDFGSIRLDTSDILDRGDAVGEAVGVVEMYFGNGKKQLPLFFGIFKSGYRDSAAVPFKLVLTDPDEFLRTLNDPDYHRGAEFVTGFYPMVPVVGASQYPIDPRLAEERGLAAQAQAAGIPPEGSVEVSESSPYAESFGPADPPPQQPPAQFFNPVADDGGNTCSCMGDRKIIHRRARIVGHLPVCDQVLAPCVFEVKQNPDLEENKVNPFVFFLWKDGRIIRPRSFVLERGTGEVQTWGLNPDGMLQLDAPGGQHMDDRTGTHPGEKVKFGYILREGDGAVFIGEATFPAKGKGLWLPYDLNHGQ
ncbi:MAG: hypothetical protein OEV37_03170 [Candidatus Berkelbacteria bacterium]|nr:hypothetical protein [Candidatus Berkelbacteria bacterium]